MDLVGHGQPSYPAKPALEPDMVGVRVQHLPQRLVRRPGQRLVAVPPRRPEPDPHRRPVGRNVPIATVLHQQPVPDLERLPRPVLADRRGPNRPHAQVQCHQLELEVTENVRVDQHGRHVVMGCASHTGTLTRSTDIRQPRQVPDESPTSRRGSLAQNAGTGERSWHTPRGTRVPVIACQDCWRPYDAFGANRSTGIFLDYSGTFYASSLPTRAGGRPALLGAPGENIGG